MKEKEESEIVMVNVYLALNEYYNCENENILVHTWCALDRNLASSMLRVKRNLNLNWSCHQNCHQCHSPLPEADCTMASWVADSHHCDSRPVVTLPEADCKMTCQVEGCTTANEMVDCMMANEAQDCICHLFLLIVAL
jgi:hypothetical protein